MNVWSLGFVALETGLLRLFAIILRCQCAREVIAIMPAVESRSVSVHARTVGNFSSQLTTMLAMP